ncbi:MAG: DUF1800 family protein [Cyclobacteriaceae bacterium]
MPFTPLNEILGKERAAHLLRRTSFGASVKEIDAFALLTPTQAFAQLYDDQLPEAPLPIDLATGTEWITTGTTDANSESFILGRHINAWQIGQILAAGVSEDKRLAYSFRERLVFFLHTHFTTKQSISGNNRGIYYQSALFRKYAFDRDDWTRPNEEDPSLPDEIIPVNFLKLTNKLCVDNAMLVFLDGRLNVKGSPNENFARELLELYVIGRGLEGIVPASGTDGDYFNYTEQDVQEGARVLSGFDVDGTFSNIDEDTGLPRGVIKGGTIASAHDNGVKTLSERFDSSTIQPTAELTQNGSPTEESLLDEISQLLDIVYAKNETALHICRKLYRFFVYHDISESVQSGIIQDMADIFRANEFKLYPVLEALFTSREFYEGGAGYEDDAFGSIIKSPLDLVAGLVKNFEIEVPDYTSWSAFYNFHQSILNHVSNMGMDFYEPFEVAGYPAYHQFPIYNRSWITTNYLTQRYDYIARAFEDGIAIGSDKIDIYDLVKTNIDNATARDAKALVIALTKNFLPVSGVVSFDDPATSELTEERLNYFLTTFLGDIDVDPEASWTFRWDNEDDVETMTMQLVNLMNALLQSPEYQLM